MKMWDGRFSKNVDARVNDFNSSLRFDFRMYKCDIRGSAAHALMLGECGIIGEDDAEKIICALAEIESDIDSGKLEIDPEAEDIHMFIESVLTKRIGDTGKKLHTARSRNDQVALDMRMYLLEETENIIRLSLRLLEVICSTAENHAGTVMPGYTHLQRAQPLTFGHCIMAYSQMIMRDIGRLEDCRERMNVMPLGSGALASTTYPIDRKLVANILGFPLITENSVDGVSDRDFVIELCSDLSILMMHMSRFAEEIVLWCSSEFSFIELDDAFSTGSSIMPQKKNPDVAELVRGKTGRVYGDLMTLLAVMKSLPLAYNKDMQEDKEAVFDAVDNTKLCLEVFAPMFASVTVKTENMRKAASGGFINATDCADYLVKKGLPFRDAYKISGQIVARCIDMGTTLEELPLEVYKKYSEIFEDDIYGEISLIKCVNGRSVYGGPSEASVLHQIEIARNFIMERDFRPAEER